MTVTSDGKGATLAQAPAHAPVGIGRGVSRPAQAGAGPKDVPQDAALRVLVVTADDPARFRAQGGDYRKMEEQGLFFVVAAIECKYHQPARYDDVLTLRTTIANASFAKLKHDYEVLRDGQLLAKAHSVLACVNRKGDIQRIPDVIAGSA